VNNENLLPERHDDETQVGLYLAQRDPFSPSRAQFKLGHLRFSQKFADCDRLNIDRPF
jgi:hypothetical protein